MEEDSATVGNLPEGCISHFISFTTPLDACRSALVSTTFRSAADSDTVWDRFLPPDYDEILSRAVSPVDFSSKKDLYFRLCDPILVDAGRMSFALDKSTGAKCYTISARGMSIVWGDTPHYWNWVEDPESRFSEVAELLNVCWLELRGKIDCRMLSPKTHYAAYLIFKIKAQASHGLGVPAQKGTVRVGTHVSNHAVCLHPEEAQGRTYSMRRRFMRRAAPFLERAAGADNTNVARAPFTRNGWMEIELGDFFNDDGSDEDVEMSLLEVAGGHWKGGLIVMGIEVRPKK